MVSEIWNPGIWESWNPENLKKERESRSFFCGFSYSYITRKIVFLNMAEVKTKRILKNKRNAKVKPRRSFSKVEDGTNAIRTFRSLGRRVAMTAASEARKAGIQLTYMDFKGQLIQVGPNGLRTILKKKSSKKRYFYEMKPGTVYHAPSK